MITPKVSQLRRIWTVLGDLAELNDNPFRGHARRLLFKLQPEMRFLQELDTEDYEAIKDRELELGQEIPTPEAFPDEYADVIELVCGKVPDKPSQLAQIVENGVKE